MNIIPNAHLIEKDIPSRRASWNKIVPFAMTFNGYKHWGTFKKCREVARQGAELFRTKQELPKSLIDLRTCLFYEARRLNHFEKKPSKNGMEYIRALVEAIRVRVLAKETG